MLKLNLPKQLPLLNQPIWNVHKMLQIGQITPIDLVKACLQRIEETKVLNAFITVPEQLALQHASESKERFAKGQCRSLIDGIPISFKDNFNTKNIRTTCGSKMLEHYIPPYSATVVEKLVDNGGAILIGKTNMDEFAMGSACSESYFGPTYHFCNSNLRFDVYDRTFSTKVSSTKIDDNHDNWFISGGSSGGSAVSVATGASFAALSSDTGGSTRNPASRLGIVGFKPSYGTISRYGLIPLTHSLDVPGIMARNVQDVATIYDCLQGVDVCDSTTVKMEQSNSNMNLNLKNITIGIPDEYRGKFLDQNISQTWDDTIQLLINSGARITRISLPHTKYSLACYTILNTCEVASNFACYDGVEYGYRTKEVDLNFEDCYTSTREHSLNDIVKSRIMTGNYFLLQQNYDRYYNRAMKLRRLITDDFEHAFEKDGVDFIVTPVTITQTMSYSEWTRMDKTEEAIKEDYCTQPTNMAGLPAIAVPVKLDPVNNLPIGLQLIGKKFDDYRLLQFATKFESLLDFPHFVFDGDGSKQS